MNQLTLDFEQQKQLDRVALSSRDAVLEFFNAIECNATFHAQELRDYVAAQVTVAPSSPDRIMRLLRKQGLIQYEVVSRSKSLYRKLSMA